MNKPPCPCCPNTQPPDHYQVETSIDGLTTDEMEYDDSKHLRLGVPTTNSRLDTDMGYDQDFVNNELPSSYGTSSTFSVLSKEGIRVVDHVLNAIEKYAVNSPRIPNVLRGGAFRSNFLNGLGHSAAILSMVSALARCELIYHPMKIHQVHVNLKPNDDYDTKDSQLGYSVATVKKNVDKWHVDTTPFVLIVFCTDPESYEGGELRYFQGTKEEGLYYLNSESEGYRVPEDRVRHVGRQHKGHGVFMQGSRVFHQVAPVLSGSARTTMVFSFQPRDVLALEACSQLSKTYNSVDPLHILIPDWVRYRSWKLLRRLEILMEHFPLFSSTGFTVVAGKTAPGDGDELKDLIDMVKVTRTKFEHIVLTLPYTDDRVLLSGVLIEAVAGLKSQLATFQTTGIGDGQDFAASQYGLANLQGAVADIESCIDDVLTLKNSSMVYF